MKSFGSLRSGCNCSAKADELPQSPCDSSLRREPKQLVSFIQKSDCIISLPFKGGGPLAVEGFHKFAIHNCCSAKADYLSFRVYDPASSSEEAKTTNSIYADCFCINIACHFRLPLTRELSVGLRERKTKSADRIDT